MFTDQNIHLLLLMTSLNLIKINAEDVQIYSACSHDDYSLTDYLCKRSEIFENWTHPNKTGVILFVQYEEAMMVNSG